ncbi:MAG: hypothetical protein J5855_02130 [Mailhella sp.]|nr:hypothetical protein [Mailhella sp.]
MPGGITLQTFEQAADSTSFASRGLKVDEGSHEVKLGNFVFTQSKDVNQKTMAAFRSALAGRHGIFGERAFDAVLGGRQMTDKDLRACDVKAVLSKLPDIRLNALKGELMRRLDTDPKLLALPPDARKALRSGLMREAERRSPALVTGTKQEDVTRLASEVIAKVLKDNPGLPHAKIGHGVRDVSGKVSPWKPTGLDRLGTTVIAGDEASVEDRMSTGTLGVGQRVNRSQDQPMLLHSLKKSGVEPGFLYSDDWSANDTRMLLGRFDRDTAKRTLAKLERDHPAIAAQGKGKPFRERIMLFGRMHPAGMAAVADYMLEKGMKDPRSEIYRAFREQFPGKHPDQWRTVDPAKLKKALFPQIRDAILSVKKEIVLPDGTKQANPDYPKSPIFRQFSDRHIVKLDYNESTRYPSPAGGPKYMLPPRAGAQRGVFGPGYRWYKSKSAVAASADAVTEALANDLTRLCRVPAQELHIVRGQYSDGTPKLMLEAKFADGYKDIGPGGYLRDGQIVAPPGEGKPESLGRFKAFFLALADRDAVGSKGQNKGFAHGSFFAIDPGHSLEGNGKDLVIEDDLSFTDTNPSRTHSRFANYSVFDDDSRCDKLMGAYRLREMKNDGSFERLFDSYAAAFDPEEPGILPKEKELREAVLKEIGEKKKEFFENVDRVLNAVDSQLKFIDALKDATPEWRRRLVETVANLEKITSPTTWVSPRGEVPLTHLAVVPGKRVPWDGAFDGNSIVYTSRKPLSPEAQSLLRRFADSSGAGRLEIDGNGFAKLTFDAKRLGVKAINVFSEGNVAKITHPQEYAARKAGGSGLAEAKTYKPMV